MMLMMFKINTGVRGWGPGPEDLQKALEREGRGFVFTKIDWADVYKHILTIDSDIETILSTKYFLILHNVYQ